MFLFVKLCFSDNFVQNISIHLSLFLSSLCFLFSLLPFPAFKRNLELNCKSESCLSSYGRDELPRRTWGVLPLTAVSTEHCRMWIGYHVEKWRIAAICSWLKHLENSRPFLASTGTLRQNLTIFHTFPLPKIMWDILE